VSILLLRGNREVKIKKQKTQMIIINNLILLINIKQFLEGEWLV